MRARALSPTLILVTAATTLAPTSAADPDRAPTPAPAAFSFAVIGDLPYGETQLALMPRWIGKINAANPALTVHVGDIKTSARRCDSTYMKTIRGLFNRFDPALVYTPGDNEWADCHQLSSGSYSPLERVRRLREIFFAVPGRSLGTRPIAVASQASAGFPENVRISRDGIVLVAVHTVGANDDLLPWTGNTTATAGQKAEQARRMHNGIRTIEAAFAHAKSIGAKAVAIFLHADMFDPTHPPRPAQLTAYKPLVQTLIEQANQYRGEVYLFNGDSHRFNDDHPLQSGSKWLSIYGVHGYSTKLHRVTVDGDTNVRSFLKVTANAAAGGPKLSWVAIPL